MTQYMTDIWHKNTYDKTRHMTWLEIQDKLTYEMTYDLTWHMPWYDICHSCDMRYVMTWHSMKYDMTCHDMTWHMPDMLYDTT